MKSLYLIEAGKDGPVKIGIATDPDGRLRSLQTGSASELRLMAAVPLDDIDAEWAEEMLHDEASSLRLRGEWFHPEVIDFLYWRLKKLRDEAPA